MKEKLMFKTIQTFILCTVLLWVAASCFTGCDGNHQAELQAGKADSLIFQIGARKDYDRMLAVIDSLELKGVIPPLIANRWRGTAYYRMGKYRLSENWYRKVFDYEVTNEQEQLSYNKSARRLSELLLIKGDFEGSLRIAIPAVQKMEQTGTGSDIDMAILLNNIGCCQLNLGRDDEANESFLNARGHYANRWENDSSVRGLQEAVIGTVYTSQAYINTRRFEKSLYWIDRTEMLLNKYRQKPDARDDYLDEYQGRIEIMRAVARQGLGETEEAAHAYKAFLQTDYSKTSTGRVDANDYLLRAHRYAEAADNYRYLSQMLAEHSMVLNIDNIQLYMLPKLRANVGAHRTDSVMALSLKLCDYLDTAIKESKDDETAQLSTAFETAEKEARIVQQQAEMAKQRLWGTGIALILVIVFFTIYTMNRRRQTKKLAVAHSKLQTAYDQLEETTAAKERIESELRIARDIQMSMVPSVFPHQKGLDIYASMTPAKEVGGDLYGYMLINRQLYFCIGDVSGKGVPASLFMAQATRLFRILATQGMMPAEIATRMNAALAENNEQGMFVTMFIGLANLQTGKLTYCNAGHNPPICDGQFLQVESNAPIGLWPDLEFVGETIENIFDKPFFIYTDGLNEAENQEQLQFGEAPLLDILQHSHFTSAKQVVETLNTEVEHHRNGNIPNDDLTMLCLKISKPE